jgi:endonuclease/exonuclease/phosphatase family metal-dependent hydrolase
MIPRSWLLAVLLVFAAACSDETKNDGEPDAGREDAADALDAGDDAGAADIGDPGTDGAEDGGDPGTDRAEDAGDYDDAGDGDVGEEPDAGGDDGGEADASGDPGEPAKFSVLTINLKHPLTGIDEALQRLQIVADAVNDRKPDVVALQEVIKDTDQPSFAEQLGTLAGYEWIWEYTFTVPTLFEEGLGILSRWPIVWSDSAELRHLDLVIFRRRVLGARVQSPYGEIRFFCTHMTTDSDETVKADQAADVYQFIQANPSTLAGFLAGDLNAEPDTLAMRFFRGEASHEGLTGDLVDSWMTANPGDDGFTMSSSNPEKRIDYIYLVPGSEKSAEVVSCELMFTEQVGGLYASDHLGVLCEFSLQP